MSLTRWCRIALPLVAVQVFTASCSTMAEYKRATYREPPIRVTNFVLPNGLRVVVEQDTGAQMVGVSLTIGAGSYDDPAGREGLAHFIEHLTFRKRVQGEYRVQELLEYSGVGA